MKGNVPEDVYTLSPIQEGVLFHSLFEPKADVYFRQFSVSMQGALNLEVFAQAWREVIRRHRILRTAFFWEGLEKPLQAVHAEVELPIEQHDWRRLSETEQAERLSDFLRADQARGFELSTPPLMRLTIMRLSEAAYQVIWSYHNLLLDGWSKALVIDEVLSFYEAYRRGRELNLPRSRPYRDYIAWLRQQDLSKAEQFWRQWLANFTEPTSLLTSFEDVNPVSGHGYQEEKSFLSERLTKELNTFARQQQLTLNTIALGTWAIVLARYSGEDDVVFGITVSGRPAELAGVESMVGPFINTLPMRVKIDWDEMLLTWLRNLQAQQLGLRQYEYSPLTQVQGWSEVPRGKALFESIFVFENYPFDAEAGSRTGELRIGNAQSVEQTNYPLTVGAEPGPEFLLHLGYHATRFSGQTIVRMLRHWEQLLENVVADPQRRLIDISFLTGEEQQKLLVEINDTASESPLDQCLHYLFQEQVSRTPGEIAIVFGEEKLTYQELNARANQLAHHLSALGVGPEVLVGICMEHSPEMLIGILGVLKAGGAYVPLDPDYPRERLRFMLNDARVELLLSQQRLATRLPDQAARVVAIDAEWSEIASSRATDPMKEVEPENLAYVIYTSGSSGRPKGVMISHRSVCNHLDWMQRAFPLSADDRVPLKYSFSFDVCVLESLWPLLAGARLIVGQAGKHRDVEYLANLMAEHSITSIDVVPSMLEILLDVPAFAKDASLKRVTCGGEALPPDLQQRFFAQTLAELHNIYGPTEATIGATCWSCRRSAEQRRISIGLPISNTQVYVLDKRQRVVPIGVPGELHIAGVGLARGYLHRPDLTAASFIPNPFAEKGGERLYRTGDLARYLSDGNLEFLGRVDEQVKIRGFRIEPAEIETALKEYEGVDNAVVLAREISSATGRFTPAAGAAEASVMELTNRLLSLPAEEHDRMLAELEKLSDVEAQLVLKNQTQDQGQVLTRKSQEFEIALSLTQDDFIRPPQQAQRNWTLQRALDEFVDDLKHLDQVSKRFVPGSERAAIQHQWDRSAAHYDDSQLIIEGQQVMQDWERPLMKAMAEIVTEGHGDVLEIGFGMGISAGYIQERGVKSHSIVECNEQVIERFNLWQSQYPERDIRLIRGKWQEVTPQLGLYDGIFFDTYPLSEAEFEEYVINNITFAEGFFPVASACLKKGGVFSYYTNEIDSFSRRHQRLVLKHFDSFTLSVVRSLSPPLDCNYWWADSMVVIKAVK